MASPLAGARGDAKLVTQGDLMELADADEGPRQKERKRTALVSNAPQAKKASKKTQSSDNDVGHRPSKKHKKKGRRVTKDLLRLWRRMTRNLSGSGGRTIEKDFANLEPKHLRREEIPYASLHVPKTGRAKKAPKVPQGVTGKRSRTQNIQGEKTPKSITAGRWKERVTKGGRWKPLL